MKLNNRRQTPLPWHSKEFTKATMTFKASGPESLETVYADQPAWWINHIQLGWLKMVAPHRPERAPLNGDIFEKDGQLFELDMATDATEQTDTSESNAALE